MFALALALGIALAQGAAAAGPFPPKLRDRLRESLNSTRIGCAVSSTLARLAGPDSPRWALIDRGGQGPIAEFHEPDEIVFDSARLFGNGSLPAATEETVLSFLVHEETHALAYRLHVDGRFPFYDPRTKLNEALAYLEQGVFIDEWRAQGKVYRERFGVAPWDERVLASVRGLRNLGIDDSTPPDKVFGLFADADFDAASEPERRQVESLREMYTFIKQSSARRELWALRADTAARGYSTLAVVDRVREDAQAGDFRFPRTFAFMKDRIPLYSAYPDLPAGLDDGRPYIEAFERSLDFSGCAPDRR